MRRIKAEGTSRTSTDDSLNSITCHDEDAAMMGRKAFRVGRREVLCTGGAALLAAGAAFLPKAALSDAPADSTLNGSNTVARAADRTIAEMDAVQVVAAIRSRTLKAEEIVTVLLRRIDALKDLNACLFVNADSALEAARAVDKANAAGQPLPPLAGLPLLVKDNINHAGHPTTAGTWALRNFRPTDTAPVLQRLLDQGAILLAKANMHELALGATSTNAAFGFVRNPYDRDRVSGGSSGGSAAGVAARLAPAALGTDTGASVRQPAAFCGGAALRPSVGNGGQDRRYPVGGVAPISSTRDTVGPMARSVGDVALLDATIVGSPQAAPADLRGVRLALPRRYFWENLDEEVARICEEIVPRLRAMGVQFVEADLEGVPEATKAAAVPVALYEIGREFPRYLAASGSPVTWAEVQEQAKSPDVRAALTAARGVTREAYDRAISVDRPRLQRIYADYFRQLGVDGTLFPTVPVPAPLIDPTFSGAITINGKPQPGGPGAEFLTLIRNLDGDSLAGIPGVSMPVGMTRSGLPVGLELDGPLGSDTRLLSIALSVEAVVGRIPPPLGI